MGVCVSSNSGASASYSVQAPGESAPGLEVGSSGEQRDRAEAYQSLGAASHPLCMHELSDQDERSAGNVVDVGEGYPNGGEDLIKTAGGPRLVVQRSPKKKGKSETGPKGHPLKMEDRVMVIDRRAGTGAGRDRMRTEQPIMKVLLVSDSEKSDDMSKAIKDACQTLGYPFERMHNRKEVKAVFERVRNRLDREHEVVRQSRHRHRIEDLGRRGPATSQVPQLAEVEEEGENCVSDRSMQGPADQQRESGIFNGEMSPPDLLLINCRSARSACSASACELVNDVLQLGQAAEGCVFAAITGRIPPSQWEAVQRNYLLRGFHDVIQHDSHLNWRARLFKLDRVLCRFQFSLEESRAAWMLLDCSPVSYEITSSDVKFEYVNEAFENMTGYRAERVLGYTPKQVLKSSMNMDIDLFKAIDRRLRQRRPWYGHYFGRRQSGYHYPQSVQIIPCPSIYGPPHHVTIKQDLSKQIVTNLCLKQLCIVGRRTLQLLDGTDVLQPRRPLPSASDNLSQPPYSPKANGRKPSGDPAGIFQQLKVDKEDPLPRNSSTEDSSPLVNGDLCHCDHGMPPSPTNTRQSGLLSPTYGLRADHMYPRMIEMVNQLEVRDVLQRATTLLENDSEKLDETIYQNYMAEVQKYMNDLRSDTDTTALYNVIALKKDRAPHKKEKSFVTGLMNLRSHRGSISNSATSSQKSMDEEDREHVQCLQTRLIAFYRDDPVILDTMKLYQNWSNFDIFTLEHQTNHKPLYALGMKILDEYDACSLLKVDWSVVERWLMLIESFYHNGINSYHNSTHAADVLQAAACFLRHERFKVLEPLEKLATLLAAIIHDLDHPGLTGPYLIKISHPLAEMYNDRSVLENHHLRVAFSLARQHPDANIFQNLEKDDFKTVKSTMVELVLATDITQHQAIMNEFTSQLQSLDVFNPGRSPLLSMLKVLLKVADVSNPGRPLDICITWADRIAQEYVHQSDLEKANDMPLTFAMFSRSSYDLPSSQLAFYNYIIKPMFASFHSYTNIDDLQSHLAANYAHWEKQKDVEGSYQPAPMRTNDFGNGPSLVDTVQLSTDYSSLRSTVDELHLSLPVISIQPSSVQIRGNTLIEMNHPPE